MAKGRTWPANYGGLTTPQWQRTCWWHLACAIMTEAVHGDYDFSGYPMVVKKPSHK